ncbi:MAG TPA: SDR family oxidoreductase [Stellaceae bacterium]|jgi:NAD(P)-dependent dehydrogenase (short-subunit alcohol dehydrogenase family)
MTVETVVITGASAGVGRATARAFAKEGARIGLLARGAERLNATAAEVKEAGGEALVLPTDVADADAVEAAAAAVERAFGPIDIWVNNAMATIFAPVSQITPEEYRRATEVTYLGCVHGTMAALKRMRPRNRGAIVQVGSALAYRAIPLQAPYCGAKHAIRGFTDSLRCELMHENSDVHVTMVQMPALNTPQFDWARNKMGRKTRPMGTIYQPEVAAEAILFAAHARRREVLVGGSTVEAVWGNKAAPGLLDHLLAWRAVDGQLTDEPADTEKPGNLFASVAGDCAAHGRFDALAKSSSTELELQRQPGVALAVGLGLAAGLAALLLAPRVAAR